MEKDLILSICVPHYNGGERCIRNVKEILSHTSNAFEIVISDNQSTDDTLDKLREINDKRLRICRNKKNVGPLVNGICAIERGRGKYCMLLLDRDILQVDYLTDYLDFLENHEYGVIFNMQFSDQSKELGRTEAIYWANFSPHPSCFVYLREALQKVPITKEIRSHGYYPALISMYILNSYVCYYNAVPVVVEAEKEYIIMHQSRSWYGWRGRISGAGFELSEFKKRHEWILDYYKKINKKYSCEDLLAIYRSYILRAYKDVYYFSNDTFQRYRYEIREEFSSLEKYRWVALDLLKYSYKQLIKMGAHNIKLLYKITEISLRNYITFMEDASMER